MHSPDMSFHPACGSKKAVRLAWPSGRGDQHASDLFGLCHSGAHTTIGNISWLTVGLVRHVHDGQFCSGALLLSMIDRFCVQPFFSESNLYTLRDRVRDWR